MKHIPDPGSLVGPLILFLGISGVAFVALIWLLVWSNTLP